jgi:hypothetical protein
MQRREPPREIRQPGRPQYSLRALLRATSCVCLLSAIPGFWPAVILFALGLAAFLLPGISILAGLVLAQCLMYAVWKRALKLKSGWLASDDPCFQVQVIERK